MQGGADGLIERVAAASDENADRGEERPEEALPPIPEWMSVIEGAPAANHPDEQEHLDGHIPDGRRNLGSERNRPGLRRRDRQHRRLQDAHAKGGQHAPLSRFRRAHAEL
jgi:hypothetical protein